MYTRRQARLRRYDVRFTLLDGSEITTSVHTLLNAGYAGRSQDDVAAHVKELAELGVPAPSVTPALYPVAPYLAQQADAVPAQHGRTSGEAEWALVITDDGVLLTAACDHTDRELEVHGVAWSKNAAPDVLARKAWRLDDLADLDSVRLQSWVDGALLQDGTLAELLTPQYWLPVLEARGLAKPGTVLLSGTLPMDPAVDQFGTSWRVALTDPATGDVIDLAYTVETLPEPIG
ncbi:DUF2848 domain-containing protein [Amycolatopsis rhabdoformis]|uniref:DUF2848 domain-containing protein n=1 Tax=Amycolatopsis rhabdoformis TaxID=1448059 RepID=A0ABZ1I296_9PSEU|nr:DUF2848 domain-containing protein [Amycolatopsis rhabdoformis]WSE27799.1 DUF2848 domain-containing protein [Amycolatopsis rhabdoformis]